MEQAQECPVSPYPMDGKTKRALKSIKGLDYSSTSDLFMAVADPTRVKIIEALGVKELCVCVLVDMTGLKYPALSYHLKHLKESDIISFYKEKNFLVYYLTKKGKAVHDFIIKSRKL